MSTEFYWIAVAAVVILASSRLTRLVVFDKFPPVRDLRNKYIDLLDGGPYRRRYQLLVLCGYCFSLWATLLVVVTGDLAGVFDGEPVAEWATPAWWLTFGTLAASYVAAIIMALDGDDSSSEDED